MIASNKSPQFTKIQELIYELKVGQVMQRMLITVSPDTMMSELRAILRDNRISGTPVLEGEVMVGLITKGDVIEGLLHELQIDCHEEEIHRYRASHFFEYMIADRITINFHYHIRGKSIEKGARWPAI